MKQVIVFNGVLDKFLNYLETISIELKTDIALTKTVIYLMKNSHPTSTVDKFMSYSQPYKSKLINCDENFFLSYNAMSSNEHFDIISKLKSVWKTLDQKQKATIFYYFHMLLDLGEKCVI